MGHKPAERAAGQSGGIPGSGSLKTIKELFSEFQRQDASGLAAELAYRFLFAIFPFAIFIAALAGFVARAVGLNDPTHQIVGALGDNLPPDIAASLVPVVRQVLESARPDLLSLGAVLALWAATSGTLTLIKAMNRAFDIAETRSIVRRYALAIGLTILGGAGVIGSFVTVVGGTLLTQVAVDRLGLTPAIWSLIELIRWPAVFVVLVIAVSVLFRYAPNVRPPWRWTLAGAAMFAISWLVATWGFAIYVAQFSNLGQTYGSLSGVIVLLLWFYLTALLLVVSSELVAVLTRQHDPEALEERRRTTGPAAIGRSLREVAERGTATVERTLTRAGETLPRVEPARAAVARPLPRPAVPRPVDREASARTDRLVLVWFAGVAALVGAWLIGSVASRRRMPVRRS